MTGAVSLRTKVFRPTVVSSHPIPDTAARILGDRFRVRINTSGYTWSPDELATELSAAHGFLAFMTDRIDERLLSAARNLRVVGGALKGNDNWDINALDKRGILWSVVGDLLTIPTAELAIGLMIGLDRNVLTGDTLVKAGRHRGWRPGMHGIGLAGSTIGLIGLGAVGRAIADRLLSFGARIHFYDPHVASAPAASRVASLDLLLPLSDYAIVAAPLTSETRKMIGASQLALVKPHCRLINISRGSVVDEEAVAAALASGRLGGYAADVFAFEDLAEVACPADTPPALLDPTLNTLFTPHLGSAVGDVRAAIAEDAARSIVRLSIEAGLIAA